MRARVILWLAVLGASLTAGCAKREQTGEGEAVAPAGAVAWGEAVDGLQAGIEIRGRQFEAGEIVEVAVHARNAGDKNLRLFDGGDRESWPVVFTANEGGEGWVPAARVPGTNRAPTDLELPARETKVAVRQRLGTGGDLWYFGRAEDYHSVRFGRPKLEDLPPRKYVVTARYSCVTIPDWVKGNKNYWTGKVTTGSVKIEITSKRGAAAAE